MPQRFIPSAESIRRTARDCSEIIEDHSDRLDQNYELRAKIHDAVDALEEALGEVEESAEENLEDDEDSEG